MSGGYSTKKNMAIGRVMQKPYATVTSIGEVNQKRRKTKMSFKQRLRNWLYDDSADEPIAITRDENDLREEQSINFSVIPAAGGRIVQVRTYDQRTDRNSNKLHIITPDENLAESLAQILQIEQLSR
jgi:hypothetical protein